MGRVAHRRSGWVEGDGWFEPKEGRRQRHAIHGDCPGVAAFHRPDGLVGGAHESTELPLAQAGAEAGCPQLLTDCTAEFICDPAPALDRGFSGWHGHIVCAAAASTICRGSPRVHPAMRSRDPRPDAQPRSTPRCAAEGPWHGPSRRRKDLPLARDGSVGHLDIVVDHRAGWRSRRGTWPPSVGPVVQCVDREGEARDAQPRLTPQCAAEGPWHGPSRRRKDLPLARDASVGHWDTVVDHRAGRRPKRGTWRPLVGPVVQCVDREGAAAARGPRPRGRRPREGAGPRGRPAGRRRPGQPARRPVRAGTVRCIPTHSVTERGPAVA